ncbi:Alpha/Beta hydrolase protein [Mycena olivaceomarginata]|nr:Alpha/Beta hydrolase protein [Mycena olivaceomarginata]
MVPSTLSLKLITVATISLSLFPVAMSASDFDWSQLTPSEKLIWTPCYSGFECSRLIVPLDYALAATGTAAIAVTRYPSSSKSDYRGPVLLNPGGPGGSGVNYVVEAGPSISTILGSNFDIVGFDPRGVSYSTPTVSFFKTDAERALWMPAYVNPPYPSPNASSGVLAETRAKGQILGTLAQNRNDHYEYMTTDNTARDMLRITEAFGWEKVQYWGISYGSVLGSTFAALFPDKVGRVVIDGVLDMEAWYGSNLTIEMSNSDDALQSFFDGCSAAGPGGCAFSAPTSAEVASKLDELSASVKAQLLPVFTPISYGVLGYTLLRNFVYNALADPYDLFPFLGQSLADLANGNASTMYSASVLPPFECPVHNSTTPVLPFHENSFEAAVAISCGDGIPISSSLEELQEFYEGVQEVTKNFAEFALYFRTLCSGWKLELRKDRFQGPFGAPNTSFPLLVIGNTADPVTPIVGAVKTVEAFPGSALLTVDSPGHTSTAVPSTCVHEYLRAYFRNGTLPTKGTVCTPDSPIFPAAVNATQIGAKRDIVVDDSQEELKRAGRALREAVRRVGGRKFQVGL